MSAFFVSQLLQLSFVVVCSIQLTAALFMLRTRVKGTGIMVGGGVISMMGQAVYLILPLFFSYFGISSTRPFFHVVLAVITLGWVLFSVGLLVYALHRRAQGNRVAELEAILESLQKS